MIYNGYIAATSEARIRTDDATKVHIFCGEDDTGEAPSLIEAVGSGVGLEEVDSRSVPASEEAVCVVKGKAVEEVPEAKDKAVDEVAAGIEGTPTKSATAVLLGCELLLGEEKEEELGT